MAYETDDLEQKTYKWPFMSGSRIKEAIRLVSTEIVQNKNPN